MAHSSTARGLKSAATGLVLATVLAGSVSCRLSRAPSAGGATLRIGHESDLPSLDPTVYTEVATWSILGNIYEGLVTFDGDMTLTPALASSWNTPDDHTWIFDLRKGVRFHDGRPLTAEDVRYSIERASKQADSGVKGYLSTIEHITTPNDHTVEIRVSRPDPLMLNRLANVLVVPAAYGGVLTHPIGTGPYRFVAWQKGTSLEVAAFPDYWRGKPAVDHVHFIPVEDTHKGLELLRTGGIDVLRWIPEGAAAQVRSTPHARLEARAGLAAYYLWFDCRPRVGQGLNPFADRRLRQAISLAVDREELARRLGGFVAPLNQLVHDSVVGYVADLAPLRFDPAEARRLMALAGHPKGLKVTLTHRPQTSLSLVSGALGEMLGKIGIEVDDQTLDWPRMLEAMKGHLPFSLAAWQFDDGDAWTFLRDCIFTRNTASGYGSYNAGYSNPVVDQMIDEHDRIFDSRKRRQVSDRLMALLNDELPLVPLYLPQNLYGVSDRVVWKPRVDGSLFAAEMTLRPD